MPRFVDEEVKLYRRPNVRKLFQSLRDRVFSEIKPVFGSNDVVYPEAEEATGTSGRQLKETLEKLVEVGVLLRELVETRITCPSCGSIRLSVEPTCPSCGSPKLRMGEAIEHLPCGHIDFEEEFKSPRGMVCPKCGKQLKVLGVDYRKPGPFYKCLSCGNFFGAPKKKYICENCHRNFKEEESAILNAYVYQPNPEKMNVIRRESIDFRPLIKKLKKTGWSGVSSAAMKGKSTVVYSFPFLAIAKKRGVEEPNVIVQTLVGEKPVGEEPVLSLYAKTLDVNVKDVVLGVIPGLTPSARKLTQIYGFSVVEAPNPKKLVEALWKTLKEIIRKTMKKR